MTCEDCKDFTACGGFPGAPTCNDFNHGDATPTYDQRIKALEDGVSGLAYLVGKLEQRFYKVMAAIVREANE